MSGLNTYSKTLDIADYQLITEHMHVQNIGNMLHGIQHRYEHKHRAWEYGIVLNALRVNDTKSVLDVGGGGSIFAPAAAWLDMEVLQVDPGNCGHWVADQSSRISRSLGFLQKDFFEYKSRRKFDAVVCISVLEHVPRDIEFFKKLLSFVGSGGLIAMTVDFHPDGEAKTGGHLRTYNEVGMLQLIGIAREKGFDLFRGDHEYIYRGEDVNTYTFASLVMKRQ